MTRHLLILAIPLIAFASEAQTNLILSNAPDSAITGVLTNADAMQVPADEAATDSSSTNGLSTETVEIFSERLVITNIATRTPIYSGNVRVIHPRMYLTCEQLTATVPEKGRINYILAETNVVLFVTNRADIIEARADRLTYRYEASDLVTNEWIVLTGNAMARKEGMTQMGDEITYDAINESFIVVRPTTTLTNTSEFRAPAPAAGSRTNAP